LAQFTVDSGAVVYDGRTLYKRTAAYTVLDTPENYQKSLIDVKNGLITITEDFANKVDSVEQYVSLEIDLSKAAWNTVGTHQLFDVTGLVDFKILSEVTETGDDTTGDTATIQLGFNGATNVLIAATQVDDLAAGELWYDATPTTKYDTAANAEIGRIVNGVDIGYEIAGEAAKAGKIKFHCRYIPKSAGAVISVGAGAAMA
jgi:hypothetical protein